MRVAMWSGPRNLSTAMMYAFGNRSDSTIVDEPFYGAYLAKTGLNHPMRDEIMESQDIDPELVAKSLCESNKGVFYQKHMTQHMIDGIPRGWMDQVTNVFLIRHPARVVASFSAKYENPTLDDIGFVQQAELFDLVKARGGQPIVVDSADIRNDPRAMLMALCDALGLPFEDAMLQWPRGGNPSDGVWASHWYGAVHNSTGFAGPEGPLPELSGAAAELAASALPSYEKLHAVRLIA